MTLQKAVAAAGNSSTGVAQPAAEADTQRLGLGCTNSPCSPKPPSPKENGSFLADKTSVNLPQLPAHTVLGVPGKPSSLRAAVQRCIAGQRCSKMHCKSKAAENSSALLLPRGSIGQEPGREQQKERANRNQLKAPCGGLVSTEVSDTQPGLSLSRSFSFFPLILAVV